jgi:hypothetical protein
MCRKSYSCPSSDSPPAHLVVSASKSTPPPKGGVHAETAAITLAIDSLGNLFGVPTQPASKKNGIPQQLAADAVQVGVIQIAVTDQVALMNARILAGTATFEEVQLFEVKFDLAMDLINGIRRPEAISIGNMFEMQLLITRLSQMGEMSSAVVDALNQALIDMARDPKGA